MQSNWPTLAFIQHTLSFEKADESIRHIEESLDRADPRRLEFQMIRRNLAGAFHRLGEDLKKELEKLENGG